MPERILSFGGFQLLPARAVLLHNGRPVQLGARAFKILQVLAEATGQVVSKTELMAAVWPDVTVEEANIKVQLSALRKVLSDGSGSRYIVNVLGRGYSFVAPVEDVEGDPLMLGGAAPEYQLPCPLHRVIGRHDAVERLVQETTEKRLVTLVGPGGIGKTTVALAVAHATVRARQIEVCYVDLATIAEASLVPSTVAAALAAFAPDGNHTNSVLATLRRQTLLLVLDNCERLIGPVAHFVETILRGAPSVSVLATSREPLKAAGEWLHHLAPLPCPDDHPLTADDAWDYPAIQLFVERAEASLSTFELTDENVPAVVEICRRLDGVPLAIELAAAQINQIPVAAVAKGLDDRFGLLKRGRRTSLPRHQTLRATLDWSHELLSPTEQRLLRRLGAFSGVFELEAALQVAADETLDRADCLEALPELLSKSMIAVDISSDVTRYRLLETTRAYALEKLEAAGELRGTFRRLTIQLTEALHRIGSNWVGEIQPGRLDTLRRLIDDTRSALDWAFEDPGSESIAIDLSVAAVPLWLDLSLIAEGCARITRALERIEAHGGEDPREMALRSGQGVAMFSLGVDRQTILTSLRRCLALATKLNHHEYQIKVHWQILSIENICGHGRASLAHVLAFNALTAEDPNPWVKAIRPRFLSLATFLVGRLNESLAASDQALSVVPQRANDQRRTYHLDHMIASRAIRCRTLWVLGRADEARDEAARVFDEAIALGHPPTTCFAVHCGPIPVAIWSGDHASALKYVNEFHATAARNNLGFWIDWAKRLVDLLPTLDWSRNASVTGSIDWTPPTRMHGGTLSSFAPAFATAKMLQSVDQEPCVFSAEVLRAIGEQVLTEGSEHSRTRAQALLLRSTDIARQQGALAWELRTAISRAKLLRQVAQPRAAAALLADVTGRFEQGFWTADFKQATAMMAVLEEGEDDLLGADGPARPVDLGGRAVLQ